MTDEATPITEKTDAIAPEFEGVAVVVEPLLGATDAEKASYAEVSALPGLPPLNQETVDPLVGKTVLYTLPEHPHLDPRSVGQVRPAIVLRVWSKDCVNLHVLLDGPNDLAPVVSDERYSAGFLAKLAWQTSRNLDLGGRPGTWRPIA